MTSSLLTADQFDELQQRLVDLKDELARMLDDSKDSAKPVNLEEPIGRISRMDAMLVQSLAKTNRDKLVLKARQVEASLDDIRQGCYGLCRMCHKPIGYERLKARPEAPFCIACQTANEKRMRDN